MEVKHYRSGHLHMHLRLHMHMHLGNGSEAFEQREEGLIIVSQRLR